MGKGKTFTKQFKKDAVKYKKEHPELTLLRAASNLGISLYVLKHWIAIAKRNEGAIPLEELVTSLVMKPKKLHVLRRNCVIQRMLLKS